MQRFTTNITQLLIELLSLLSDVTHEQKCNNQLFLEWIVIMKLGTVGSVHNDRAAAVVWICRSS